MEYFKIVLTKKKILVYFQLKLMFSKIQTAFLKIELRKSIKRPRAINDSCRVLNCEENLV